MWESLRELIAAILKRWIGALGGAGLTLFSFVSDSMGVDVSPWLWRLIGLGLLGWSVVGAYHDVRKERDEAVILPPKPTLVGKWFHTFTSAGTVQLQGTVLRDEDGRLFVQLFDFVAGEPSTQRYMTENELQSAVFYDSNAAMQDEYYRLHPELHRY
jgi:hypothetical protein